MVVGGGARAGRAVQPWLDAAVGIHPHDADNGDDEDWDGIVAAASDPRVVAIGETGLDYDRVFSPILAQLANLRRNLALAVETGKPAILHCRSRGGEREAQDALLAELREFGSEPPRGAHPLVQRPGRLRGVDARAGCRALASRASSFRRGEEASADVVRLVPAERLLVETDSPFLSPPGAPRGRNEPEWVGITASWAAERRDENPERFGAALVENYDRTFVHDRVATRS